MAASWATPSQPRRSSAAGCAGAGAAGVPVSVITIPPGFLAWGAGHVVTEGDVPAHHGSLGEWLVGRHVLPSAPGRRLRPRRRGLASFELRGGRYLVAGLEVLLALDADAGQDLAEPAGQVPVGLTQAGHARGHEQAADDRGVQDHGDGEADAELLDGRIAVEDEA